jgi:cytochrome b561
MTSHDDERYDSVTIGLHWTTALLVIILWIIGQTADWIPNGPVNNGYWSVHVILGLILAIVLCTRIWWRTMHGRRLPPADKGLLQRLAKSVQYLLYGLLITVVTLGIVNALVRGYSLFGLVSLPQIGGRALRKPITQWHGLVANILLFIAFGHAGAALMHHYLWRDGVLKRMLPRK